MTTFTYGIECYIHMFPQERQDEINRVINHWVPVELKDGRILSKMVMNPETGVLAHCKDDKTFESYSKDFNRKNVLEAFLTPEELAMCNEKAVKIFEENREKRQYDEAKKIKASEWDDMIFDGSNFYRDIDDMYEWYDCEYSDDPEDEEYWKNMLPKYVYATKPIQSLDYNDLNRMIENVLENNLSMLEDSEDYYDYDIPEYLQQAWNKFVDENSRPYYEIDWKTVILLNE